MASRATGLGNTNFRTEDEFHEWQHAMDQLLKDTARELEDAASMLQHILSVTAVVNSQQGKYNPLPEARRQANRISRALKRAATSVSAGRHDTAAAWQIFAQYWTPDGGLAAAEGQGRGVPKGGMSLNKKAARGRRPATRTATP